MKSNLIQGSSRREIKNLQVGVEKENQTKIFLQKNKNLTAEPVFLLVLCASYDFAFKFI
jgi:hypothetical protein